MRKTYKCSLLALSVLASFTSCSESESLQQANLSNDKITFQPSLDNSWKPLSPSSSSRAAKDAANEEGPIVVPTSYGKPLYLHSLEQDGIYIWSKDGKRITRSGAPLEDGEQERAAQTRGAQKVNINEYGSFGVTAIYKEGNTNVSLFQNGGNPEIAVATPSNNFWGIQDSRWPNTGEVSFHAFAPYNANVNSPLEYTQDIANGKTQITYTASNTDIASQPDLIVATNKGSKSKEALGLSFYHALTAVTFAVDKNLADVIGNGKQLTKVELRGIRNQGTCDLSLSGTANVPSAQWTLKDDKVTYTFDVTDKNIIVGQDDYALTLGDQTLMMIPQRLDTEAKLIVTLVANGKTEEYTISLNGSTWEAGKSVIYKLSSKLITVLDTNLIYYDNSWNNFDKDGQGVFYQNDPRTDFIDYKDKMGVYIVNNKTKELILGNKYVYRGSGWWYIDGQGMPYNTSNLTYFFYYPYSKETQNVNLNANTAEEFFKEKIDNHNKKIITDQDDLVKIASADLQVGKGSFAPNGRITVQMKHQVGVAVLHMPSSQNGILVFKDDSYTYWYGEKRKRPQQGTNYTAWGIDDPTGQYFPSQKFTGNIPCLAVHKKVDDYRQWKRFSFVVPFGKTVKFQAEADPAEKRIENDWGKLFDISLTPNQNNPVVVQTVECDVPFTKIIREYEYKGSVETFTAPADETYTLQCWGAQGSHFDNHQGVFHEGGKGGYATGEYKMNKGTNIYICVGGHGNGYNNRIPGIGNPGPAGGGATSITTTNKGELSNFNGFRSEVLLVAGGGGAQDAGEGTTPKAGAGGGLYGGTASGSGCHGSGASPSEPGRNGYRNTSKMPNDHKAGFGYGGVVSTNEDGWEDYGAQGGGGYFGGGGTQKAGPAGGGSGYFKSDALTNAETIAGNTDFPAPTVTTETGHTGNGKVQIILPMPKKNKP